MAIMLQTSAVRGWKDHKQSARRIRSETRSNDRYDLKLAGYRFPKSFVDMNAVHASTGSARTGVVLLFRPVHPELVEGWFALLLSLFQIGCLYA